MGPTEEQLIVAATSVDGSTLACGKRGDAAMFETLRAYYRLVAELIEPAGGRVVKVMGDTVLLTFSPGRASEAVGALRRVQSQAGELWARFDDACRIRVRADVGTVCAGPLGAPGHERYDVVGDVLNRMFKRAPADFDLSAEVSKLLR